MPKDAHLYIGTAVGLSLLGTGLLLGHYISEGTWASLIQWVFASVVAGGVGSAYRKQ